MLAVHRSECPEGPSTAHATLISATTEPPRSVEAFIVDSAGRLLAEPGWRVYLEVSYAPSVWLEDVWEEQIAERMAELKARAQYPDFRVSVHPGRPRLGWRPTGLGCRRIELEAHGHDADAILATVLREDFEPAKCFPSEAPSSVGRAS